MIKLLGCESETELVGVTLQSVVSSIQVLIKFQLIDLHSVRKIG